MKKFIIITSMFATNILFCQDKIYSEYIVKDSLNNFFFQAYGKLYVNKNDQSKFVLSKFEKVRKESDLTITDDIFIADNGNKCKDDKEYFSDYKVNMSKSLLFENDCDGKRLIVEKIKIPKWKIYRKKIKLNNYSVYRAEAIINDRKWIVYFSTKYKTLANPWRFYGLKGAVVKAEDEKKQYTFELIKLERKISENPLENFSKYTVSNFSEYKELSVKEYTKNIIDEVSKIAIDNDALIDFKSKLPPYECLEFIEKK